jgi:hypothetical protein
MARLSSLESLGALRGAMNLLSTNKLSAATKRVIPICLALTPNVNATTLGPLLRAVSKSLLPAADRWRM